MGYQRKEFNKKADILLHCCSPHYTPRTLHLVLHSNIMLFRQAYTYIYNMDYNTRVIHCTYMFMYTFLSQHTSVQLQYSQTVIMLKSLCYFFHSIVMNSVLTNDKTLYVILHYYFLNTTCSYINTYMAIKFQ